MGIPASRVFGCGAKMGKPASRVRTGSTDMPQLRHCHTFWSMQGRTSSGHCGRERSTRTDRSDVLGRCRPKSERWRRRPPEVDPNFAGALFAEGGHDLLCFLGSVQQLPVEQLLSDAGNDLLIRGLHPSSRSTAKNIFAASGAAVRFFESKA